MQYPIPQFVEIEDQIIGPLTLKQFFFLLGGGIFLLIAWSFVDIALFIFLAVITALIVVPLAFVKPYGRPLTNYLSAVFKFILGPKILVWHKTTRIPHVKAYDVNKKKKTPGQITVGEKKYTPSSIQRLAKQLDFKTAMTEMEKQVKQK